MLLDLEHMLTSVCFQTPRDGTVHVTELQKYLTEASSANEVTALYVGHNLLFDADVTHIADVVKDLPNCEEVHLNNTQVNQCDDAILRLASYPQVKIINVLNTRLASSDRADFYLAHPGVLSKLVFVSPQWLDDINWRSVIPDPSVRESIIMHHKDYYARKLPVLE